MSSSQSKQFVNVQSKIVNTKMTKRAIKQKKNKETERKIEEGQKKMRQDFIQKLIEILEKEIKELDVNVVGNNYLEINKKIQHIEKNINLLRTGGNIKEANKLQKSLNQKTKDFDTSGLNNKIESTESDKLNELNESNESNDSSSNESSSDESSSDESSSDESNDEPRITEITSDEENIQDDETFQEIIKSFEEPELHLPTSSSPTPTLEQTLEPEQLTSKSILTTPNTVNTIKQDLKNKIKAAQKNRKNKK